MVVQVPNAGDRRKIHVTSFTAGTEDNYRRKKGLSCFNSRLIIDTILVINYFGTLLSFFSSASHKARSVPPCLYKHSLLSKA